MNLQKYGFFSFFQNNEFDYHGGLPVYNMRSSIEYIDCSTQRHLSKCAARCATGVRGQSSLDSVQGGTQQSVHWKGEHAQGT